MKTFEITKEQILDLINCSNKIKVDYRLKEWFPQAFESELEVGKWYKMNEYLFNYQGVEQDSICGYGFDFKPFPNNGVEYFEKCRIFCVGKKDIVEPATDKEVETALIAEAKRRGFKDGCILKKDGINADAHSCGNPIVGFVFRIEDNGLDSKNCNGWIFKDGKWAEICEEPIEVTLEQIAEKFGVNVEQLKIKK